MKRSFSVKNRLQEIEEMLRQEIDLLVIGGGITGAGIALDAQSRGIRTVLIEMQDFAAGTSSRSTKLVHGGLRYLKQLEVRLVAEVGKERAIVYENGPHVTKPEWMLLPIIKGGTYGKWASSFGIWLYDYLAGVKKSERRQMLNKEETLKKEPLLRQDGLKGSGYYVEYRTDDARLTLEVMKKAVEFGVKAFNYMKAEDLIYDHGKLVGVQARDRLTGKTYEIYAKKIVNATGPWCDELREKDGSKKGKYLHWTKGVHLVVDQSRFPLKQAVYFDTPDGRMCFAIPRDGKTYIGTTDTNYHEDLEHPRITKEDRDYLLAAANYMFPAIQLTPDDIESSWAGIRPLIHEEGKSPSEISRKDEIFHSESGLITIAGGKLTGYRKMAERTVDLVAHELEREEGRSFQACYTDRIPISGGEVGGSGHFPAFIEKKTVEGMSVGLDKEVAEKLARLYGSNVDTVFAIIHDGKQEAEKYGFPLDVYGMVQYGIEHEMIATPADFFIRRTGSLLFDIDWMKKWQEPVIRFMKDQLGWNKEEEKTYRDQLALEIDIATRAI
ncbi:glycerol-3-phosphate dehydrogenase/oxidase [Thermoflavimicrobium dichotomicum]|uniref:Glycerol-3-phosphate dehydrogenase n=1 Tax=Thermoflavimicrobium dichotomicum TaxID=46223 RepID=A0A1I3VDH4_9BACL|nr:glycerol-3-phosphate dehydrogenase/oxidase [Thermoflavimicrobium dichotomicum]SFJ93232.1 glycerol-3-phosphate dehydrogenase [Thermoflavimicrobium dichotomicum]